MASTRSEPLGKVRTKIVATVGPASRSAEKLAELVEAGVDVFRLNFSHGSHEEHSEVYERIRDLEVRKGRPIAVLQDLGGPKLRVGPVPGGSVECRIGEEFTMVGERTSEDPHELTCTDPAIPGQLARGDVVLFADGTIEMGVVEQQGNRARMVVSTAGTLRSRQGINLPSSMLSIQALTPKDLEDLDWTAAHSVEFVCLSFVRSATDLQILRRELTARSINTHVVAKIEKPQAVTNLTSILAATDAVMVARGDLGVEIDPARVPAIQKRVLSVCRAAGVPVITATQMLTSMEHAPRPTRAEATDVFNAVLDGTDAVMLSGETAIGQYPIEAVCTMSRICAEAESTLSGQARLTGSGVGVLGGVVDLDAHAAHADLVSTSVPVSSLVRPITASMVEAAALVARRVDAALLVVATYSGRTALAVSKRRNWTPTLALASDLAIARRMALYWGVTPLLQVQGETEREVLSQALAWSRQRDLVRPGDRVVVILGANPGDPTHNALYVHQIE